MDTQEQALPPKMTIGSVVERTKTMIPFDLSREAEAAAKEASTKVVTIDASMKDQLTDFVTVLSHLYNDGNQFHTFEHASHATMNAVKLMENLPSSNAIANDPLARLAVIFACLAHDVNHPGVPNTQLVAENTDLARMYQGRSIAEQNSIDLAWGLLEDDRFADLRSLICPTPAQLTRFHQIFVKALLATDIMDKELVGLRKETWIQAFSQSDNGRNERQVRVAKANATLELLMQAADISHSMQQFAIYQKWMRRLYLECMMAYDSGRKVSPNAPSPADGWFTGELGFIDFVVLPLAQRMNDIGLPASYMTHAASNKEQWLQRGKGILEELREHWIDFGKSMIEEQKRSF